ATPFPPPAEPATTAALPPTISCSVSRSTIQVGESANITCNGVAEEGHTVAYSYQASAGQITPRENRATLTPSAPGPVAVTATASIQAAFRLAPPKPKRELRSWSSWFLPDCHHSNSQRTPRLSLC